MNDDDKFYLETMIGDKFADHCGPGCLPYLILFLIIAVLFNQAKGG